VRDRDRQRDRQTERHYTEKKRYTLYTEKGSNTWRRKQRQKERERYALTDKQTDSNIRKSPTIYLFHALHAVICSIIVYFHVITLLKHSLYKPSN